MFFRVVRESFARSCRRKALAIVAVGLGAAVATAMLAVSIDVGDKISRELRSFGANIVATPAADSLLVEMGDVDYRPVGRGALIREADLPKLKAIFWRNNILAFAPFLSVPAVVNGRTAVVAGTWMDHEISAPGGGKFRTGARATNPTWHVEGAWPEDGSAESAAGGLAGRRLGFPQGARVHLKTVHGDASLTVMGVLTTGGPEEDQLFVPLRIAQHLAGAAGQVSKVQISALIKPDDEFALRDTASMTREEYDRWYCTPYVGSIARQVQEALPGSIARQVRQVAQNEGAILGKIRWLMLLITIAALAAAGLAISSTTATVVIERRAEIALMQALGAPQSIVALLFLTEAAIEGIIGGLAGYTAGALLAGYVGRSIFGAALSIPAPVFPLILAVAVSVSLLGAYSPLRGALRFSPAVALKEQN